MLLPSREVRTFTPLRWDGEAGVTELLVYHHAATPAAVWIRALAVGENCRFVGPQRSLRLPAHGPVVLFGDETSCAVALALAAAMPDREFACVLESSSGAAMRTALGDRVAHATLVPREPNEAHMPELVRELQTALARSPGASLLLTGRAQAIQSVRAACKAQVLPRPADTRAYWSLGKVGLD